MSGFSAEWLSLRERADADARSAAIAARLARWCTGRGALRVVDLGCGTGASVRALGPLLGERQAWHIIDDDPDLLRSARTILSCWADRSEAIANGLMLHKAGRLISVALEEADLDGALPRVLEGAHVVTAFALCDLLSAPMIGVLAETVARHGAAFYAPLTYNGMQQWFPDTEADAVMLRAFHLHQHGDKGFGPAAGPDAPRVLAQAFAHVGYRVERADSPWHLGEQALPLIRELTRGFADAVREMGAVPCSLIEDWLSVPRTGAIVGHTDLLALPA